MFFSLATNNLHLDFLSYKHQNTLNKNVMNVMILFLMSLLFDLRARLGRAVFFDQEGHLGASAFLEGAEHGLLVRDGGVELGDALQGEDLGGGVVVEVGLEGRTQALDLGRHGRGAAFGRFYTNE